MRELERMRFELLANHNLRASKSAIVERALLQAGADLAALADALQAQG